MVDKNIIDARISIILENVKRLREFVSKSEDDFLSNVNNVAAAKYYLQISIEAMVDIGNHIIARERLGVPKNNFETFEILAQNGIIDMEHLDTYRRMVRFRNVVVHLYFAVDNRRVFEVIKNNLSDFDAFIGEMRSYLDKIG